MFGKALREARLQKGLNQADLARIIGVSQQALSYYERGGRCPVDIAHSLARVLGKEVAEAYCNECYMRYTCEAGVA